MAKVVIIEVHGSTAGIVVGSTGNFRFFSSQPAFDSLDGRTFRSVQQAHRAATAIPAGQGARNAA